MGMAVRENVAVMPSRFVRSDTAMFAWLIVGILAVVAICSIFLLSRQTVSGLTYGGEVVIGADGFTPATLRVKKGGVVTWNNRGLTQHEIVADQADLGLDTGEPLEIGDAFSYHFTKTGTYTYYDTNNPSQFRGTIIVN